MHWRDPGGDVLLLLLSLLLLLLLLLLLYSPLLGLGRFFSFLILYTVGRTPWTGDQPFARPLPTHRINVHNTDIHALSGIPTHDPSVRASEKSSYLRLRGHCDRLIKIMLYLLLEFLFDQVSLFSPQLYIMMPQTVCNLSEH
jgi:hypothetical protein